MTDRETSLLLAADVGNTHTVLGVYDGEELIEHWRISSNHNRTPDELGVLFKNLFSFAGIELSDIKKVAAASVVPKLTPAFKEAVGKYLQAELFVVGPGVKTGISIKYEDPREVGADRIVNAAAAFNKFKAPVIIIDFGTATTFDYVSEEGAYMGGMIAPGLTVSMEAMFDRASKLPKVELSRPPKVLGRNTLHSIQSGILFGYACMVDGLVEKLSEELGLKPFVIATGGLAPLVVPETKSVKIIDKHLTLEGLKILYEKNCRRLN